MRSFLLTSLALLAATFKPVNADSLCKANERILFSCITAKNKLISLCANNAADNQQTAIQYRFGTSDNNELSYPADWVAANQAFAGRAQMFSGGGGIYLRFNNNGYDYVVYDGTGKGWEMHGVVVLKNKHFISYLACKGLATAELSPQMLQDMQIPVDSDESEFFPGDIPAKLINTVS